jgi:cell division protein FtsL
MGRLAVVLLALLMLSSLYLVRVSYEERRLYSELDKAQEESRRLESEFTRLKAQAQAQATPLRVERVAREKLDMRLATPAVTQYVSPQGVPIVAAQRSRAEALR